MCCFSEIVSQSQHEQRLEKPNPSQRLRMQHIHLQLATVSAHHHRYYRWNGAERSLIKNYERWQQSIKPETI